MNLDLYNVIIAGFSARQQEVFANCFIGALSMLVSEKDWQSALATSQRTMKNICPDEGEVDADA